MKKTKNSRGELTTQQIVLLIILVTSFSIILFFFFKLNLGETTNKQICHNSVILKGKSVAGFGSLDCRTNYLCISGGEECEGINPTETVEVNPDNKEEIMESIASEMADCWWMFGEGKVDYVGTKEKALGTNVCAACSIIKFDKTIQDSLGEISYEELINKGLNKPKDSQETYLSYLYDVNSVTELYDKFEIINEDVESKKVLSLNGRFMIRTGIAKGALFGRTGFDDDKIIYPYMFETNDIPEPACDEFLTKA
jgi:hypothetical protein